MRILFISCVFLLIIGHVPAQLTGLSWLSIELLQGHVYIEDKPECLKIPTMVLPRLHLILKEDQAPNKLIALFVDQPKDKKAATPKVWSVTVAEPWLVSYTNNASLTSQLIGHNALYRDPLANSEVLSKSGSVPVPLTDQSTTTLSAQCYNLSLSVRPLNLQDLVPTSTPESGRLSQQGLVFDGAALNTAALPWWSLVLVSGLVLLLLISLAVLFVVHLQSRRSVSKLTVQHHTHSRPSTYQSEDSRGRSGANGAVHRSNSVESHYDVPWDHKFRPLPDWLRTDLATSFKEGPGPQRVPRTVDVVHSSDSGLHSMAP